MILLTVFYLLWSFDQQLYYTDKGKYLQYSKRQTHLEALLINEKRIVYIFICHKIVDTKGIKRLNKVFCSR